MYAITLHKIEGIVVIFRRRRVRIEIEEDTITLGLVQPVSSAPPPKKPPTAVLLPTPSSPELHLLPARETKSTPKGPPHT
jgi:hypothetical protein